jgi:hypothetical protein
MRVAYKLPETIPDLLAFTRIRKTSITNAKGGQREELEKDLKEIGGPKFKKFETAAILDQLESGLTQESARSGAGLELLGIDEVSRPNPESGGLGRSAFMGSPRLITYDFARNSADYVHRANYFTCSPTCVVVSQTLFSGKLFPYFNSFSVNSEKIVVGPGFSNTKDVVSCLYGASTYCGQVSFAGPGQFRAKSDYVAGNYNGGYKQFFSYATATYGKYVQSLQETIGPAGCRAGGSGADGCVF